MRKVLSFLLPIQLVVIVISIIVGFFPNVVFFITTLAFCILAKVYNFPVFHPWTNDEKRKYNYGPFACIM